MLRELYYQFLVYRSIVFPFLVLSSIAVPCWLLIRLYRVRTRGHPMSLQREVLLLIVVLYFSGLAAATLEPNRNPRLLADDTTGIELRPNLTALTCSSPALATGSNSRHFCLYNAKGNVLLFFPLGILIPLVWTRLRFWRGLRMAIALSVTIEILQYASRAWGSYRSVDINDVILNVLGASLGLALVSLLRLLRGNRPTVASA
jgi:glycopeptide antibiotics resistance protein